MVFFAGQIPRENRTLVTHHREYANDAIPIVAQKIAGTKKGTGYLNIQLSTAN